MKRWEIIMVLSVTAVSVAGIVFGVTHKRRIASLSVTREVYDSVVGTAEPGKSEEIYDEYGQMTEEAEQKYKEKLQEGKCDVVIQVKDVKSPGSIPKIKQVKWKSTLDKKPEEYIPFYKKLLQDNPMGKTYTPRFFDTDKTGKETTGTTKEEPYYFYVNYYKNSAVTAGVTKDYEDTGDGKKWELTMKLLREKAKKVVKEANGFYNLNLNDKAPEEWEISHPYERTTDPKYMDGFKEMEDVYDISVRQLLAGHPVLIDTQDHGSDEIASPVEMKLVLTDTGWQSIHISGERIYRETKERFENLITVDEAADTIKEVLKMGAEYSGNRVYTADYVKLGYLDTGEDGIRPIWKFIGKLDGKIYSTEGEIIIDAVKGNFISNSVGL